MDEWRILTEEVLQDVLFPYAHENVESFVRHHFIDPSVAEIIDKLRQASEEEAKSDSNVRLVRDSVEDCISDVTHNVRHWIEIDKKVTAMKELQGVIWEEAYKQGHIKGHVYPDVFPILRSLSVPIYIYSSGSVLAQKLLFGHTTAGDMTTILSGYFDTTIGHKQQSVSYKKICEAIHLSPAEVLFLTDVEQGNRLQGRDYRLSDNECILSGYFDTTIGHKQQSVSYKKICEAIHLSPAEVLFLTDVEQGNRLQGRDYRLSDNECVSSVLENKIRL
ncbi:2,3-diketo-5-methylthio-1-phosphopentane phosphatase [Cooperia oncophora]